MTTTISSEYTKYRAFSRLSKREKLRYTCTLTDDEALTLQYTWAAWARDNQLLPPGDWTTWLILAGRGYGKTRTGAETVIQWAYEDPTARIALVGRTVADVRKVMIEGESGILACSPPWFLPKYEPSKRLLTWPNGAQATTYSADEPDQLRGPAHTKAWGDERASWQYDDAYDQLQFGLRLGAKPQCVLTTTPRATKAVKQIIADPDTIVTRGTTYENRANLAKAFFKQIIRKYEGTRLGRQELEGLVIDDIDGALWKRQSMIDDLRVSKHPELKRIVVGVDPSVTATEESAETGIIVVGVGLDDHGYVLQDRSLRATPNEWMGEAIAGYYVFKADRVVAEVNNGGDLIETLLRNIDESVSYKAVRASRGKQTRAEPVSSLYERGLVHHVGTMPDLEDQMCNWCPGEPSPDRMDALVWACTELMVKDDEPTAEKHIDWLKRYTELQQASKEKAKA
jgi:phage terminase large subunit-like protein